MFVREAEFEAAGVLRHKGEAAADKDDADEGEGTTDGQEDVAFPLATSGRRLG